jgi:hypothetical protein
MDGNPPEEGALDEDEDAAERALWSRAREKVLKIQVRSEVRRVDRTGTAEHLTQSWSVEQREQAPPLPPEKHKDEDERLITSKKRLIAAATFVATTLSIFAFVRANIAHEVAALTGHPWLIDAAAAAAILIAVLFGYAFRRR